MCEVLNLKLQKLETSNLFWNLLGASSLYMKTPPECFSQTRSPEMKTSISRIAVVLLVALLSSSALFAKSKTETIQFTSDIKVNGTLVNKGTYEVKFDEQTSELSIIKDNKVIARATATIEKRETKAQQLVLRWTGTGADMQLSGLTFAGANQDLVLSGAQASR